MISIEVDRIDAVQALHGIRVRLLSLEMWFEMRGGPVEASALRQALDIVDDEWPNGAEP